MQKEKTLLEQALYTSRKSFFFVGVFSFFVNVLMLTVPIYMLQLFDRVLASRSYDTLIFITIIAIIALLVFALLDMARSRILVHLSHWMDNFLSPTGLAKSADEMLLGGNYGAQVLRDIATLRQFLCGNSIFALFDSPWVPIYLFVIYLLHPWLGMLATIGAILLFGLAVTNELVTRKPLAEANQHSVVTQRHIDAAMRNSEVIQAMGMMPTIIQRWYHQNEKVLHLQSKASKYAGVLLSTTKFMRLTLQLLVFGFGAMLVVRNEITPGAMIAASILMARALAPVEQALGAWKQMISARVSYRRLQQHFAIDINRTAGIKLPKPKGQLALEGVYYVAPGSKKPIINNVSTQVSPGEIVGLIGASGAGKSTLARLIVGVVKANAGNIRLDGADVFTWDREDFGQYVGYLPQDIELFTGKVKENIARMGEVDDEAVIASAQLAGIHELILHLPNGYDTELTGVGKQLSGGQRQRIALARAFYKNPQLIVLDEPNSNLDNEGEEALLKAVQHIKEQGATVILIGHNPRLINQVDRIVCLKEGKVQFAGPKDQILAQLRKASVEAQQPRAQVSQTYSIAEGQHHD